MIFSMNVCSIYSVNNFKDYFLGKDFDFFVIIIVLGTYQKHIVTKIYYKSIRGYYNISVYCVIINILYKR